MRSGDKTERVQVVMEPEVKSLVERAAAKADRSLSEWSRLALKEKAKAELGEAA